MPGSRGSFTLTRNGEERELPSKISGIDLERGDIVRLETSGGGGWGNPARRDAAAIAADIAAGYVTDDAKD
jgi:N-methylhydantoinase B